MPTRQQRRAKARAPVRTQRRGAKAFVTILLVVILAGGAAATLFRAKPPKPTRGAIVNEHWHTDYSIEICGKRLLPFKTTEGEIHTHGDGKLHIHPHTPAFALNNANFGKFFESVEASIGREGSRDFLRMPDGKLYGDGDACPGVKGKQKLEFLVNGKVLDGDPAAYVMHDGDTIIVRFGPKAPGTAPKGGAAPESASSNSGASIVVQTPAASTPAPRSASTPVR